MKMEFNNKSCIMLANLIKLADEHNCRIDFGVDFNSELEIDKTLLLENAFTSEMLSEFLRKVKIFKEFRSYANHWFQLLDKNNGTHHELRYIRRHTSFIFDKKYMDYSNEELSEEIISVINKIEPKCTKWMSTFGDIYITDDKVKVFGFTKETPKLIPDSFGNGYYWSVISNDYQYTDKLLETFNNYVCDYLKIK